MKRNTILPSVVLGCSVLTILQSIIGAFNWLELLNSAIGIAGASFFFIKNEYYRKLLNTWIYLQFIAISKSVVGIEEPVIDFIQFFHLKLGFSLGLGTSSYIISFNFLALIYLIGFKKLQVDELIGTQLTLKLYRDHDVLNSVLPQTITVLETVNYNTNDNWLLARLSKPIQYGNKAFEYCLIKAKDDLPIIPNHKSQMAHLRLVEEIGLMRVNQLKDNEFVDWVFVS